MEILVRRLKEKGYSVRLSHSISATSREGIIHIDPAGICWSASDPSDVVLPALPGILASPKARIPLDELMAMYFKVAQSGKTTLVKLSSRVESSLLWGALRASGGCGLAPDEHKIVSYLMGKGMGTLRLLTDFPCDGSVVRIYGRKRYYESSPNWADAESTLRSVEGKAVRNSYIPRDETLRSTAKLSPSKRELVELFEDLGEWCYFWPA